jgi:hypothetical protein
MTKIQLFVISILFLVVGACTKEVTPTPYPYTKVFTGTHSKTWKLKFLEQTLNGVVEETFNVPCATDDQYVFYANFERAYKAKVGLNKCDSLELDIVDDAWSFDNASATLIMTLPFFNLIFGLKPDTNLPFIVREAKKNNMELEIFLDRKNTISWRLHFESTNEN